MHQPPLLGRHDFAGDLRLQIAARDQQVIGRIVFQPGEGNREAARDLQRRGAQHVEHRHQRAVAGERGSQPLAQPPPACARSARATASPRRRPALRRAVPPRTAAGSACRAAARSPVPAHGAGGSPVPARGPDAARRPISAMRAVHRRGPANATNASSACGSYGGGWGCIAGGVRRNRRASARAFIPIAQLRGSRAVVGASGFCARWRSRWSASTQASIASPTGTARMPTHGS